MLQTDGRTICENCFEEQSAESMLCSACGHVSDDPGENMGTLPAGTMLQEKYVIGKPLGKGGFGVTYLAYDTAKQSKVAVKEYSPDSLAYRLPGSTSLASYSGEKQTHYTAGAEKFYDEARILSRFNGNEYIINVQDFFRDNNTAYYVMEFVDGIDIKRYAESKGGRLSYNEVVDIALPVMYALIIVHSMDILHRDISPDNIYLTRDGNIKLLDFGAARQTYRDQSSNLSVILKQGYTPAEQYRRHGRHGPWSDIYALGATMYFLLTGSPPVESVNRVEYDELLMPTQLGIAVPVEFDIILHKMLAVKVEDRFQNVADVKEALLAASSPVNVSAADFSKAKLVVNGPIFASTGEKNDTSRNNAGGFMKKLGSIAKGAVDKTGEMIEISKLNAKIGDRKSKIAACKMRIGENYWIKYQKGEALEAEVSGICAGIKAESELIEKYTNEIQKIKTTQTPAPANAVTEISAVNCAACGMANPSRYKYCSGCGAAIAPPQQSGALCPSCKQPVSAGVKFCPKCGASVAAR